jgi:hypothetical protein
MNVGDEVRITGHPKHYPWMKELVGKTGKVQSQVEGTRIYSVELEGETLWFGGKYLEPAERSPEASLEAEEKRSA